MTAADFALGMVGAGAVVMPGWLIARKARLPVPLLAGFLAGAVGLTSIVLALDAAGLRLGLHSVAAGWLLLTLAASWWHWRQAAPPGMPAGLELRVGEYWPLFACLVPAFGVAVYRACAQPLFGADTIFRWNYLAEQMLARGTLAFYPPVTANDYEIYAWPDGIPPTISTLYFWCYAVAGAARPALTAPVIILQFCLVVAGTHAVTRRWFSERAAAFACALLVTSPLVVWASVMGHETGFMTIAVAGLLVYLPSTRETESLLPLVFAGLAAGAAALAREYGLVFPWLGLALGMARGLSWQGLAIYGSAAALASLPWYARNWLHTGNPLFNHGVGGLFPVNEVHAWLGAVYRQEFGWGNLPAQALRLLAANSWSVAVGGLIGAWHFVRQGRVLIAFMLVGITLWIASVSHTAAGFTYSLRVLAPALLLAASLGGAVLAARAQTSRALAAVALVLAVLGLDSAARALVLPANAHRLPPRIWAQVGNALHEYHADPAFGAIARLAGNQRMLVFGPNALLTKYGARTLPLWSPEVRFLFNSKCTRRELAIRLRQANVGWILLNHGHVNERFLSRSAFLRHPAEGMARVWADGDMVLYRVEVTPRQASLRPSPATRR